MPFHALTSGLCPAERRRTCMPTLSLDRLKTFLASTRSAFTWRRIAVFIALMVVFAGGQRLAGSIFLSEGALRRQFSAAVLDHTGLRLAILGETTVSFWPSPKIVMNQVIIRRPGSTDNTPIMRIASISGRFGALSALTGSLQFSGVVLTRPEINVVRNISGRYNWQSETPQAAVNNAKAGGFKIGRIEVSDGVLHFAQKSGFSATLEKLNGTVDLPSLFGSMSFDATAVSGGRALTFSGSADAPGKLLRGETSQVSLKVASDDLTASFAGTASLADQAFLSGTFSASTAKAAATAKWIGLDYGALAGLTSVDVKASVASEGLKFTFSDLKLNLGGHTATGIVTAGWTKRGAPPFLSGTLAFDSFDGSEFLRTFIPLPLELTATPTAVDTAFLHQYQMDLRFSAAKASLGPLALTDMAAGVRVVDGHASFTLATGQMGTGSISGEFTMDDDAVRGPLCHLRLQGRNLDFTTVQSTFGIAGPWPAATGTLEADLNARLPLSPTGRAETGGTIKATGGAGKLSNFDPAAFRELAERKRFFDLSEASSAALPFTGFQLSAVIDNGIAELQKARFESPSGNLELTGVIPYKNNSLALSGTLEPQPGSNAPATRFFAGGAWPTILISPFTSLMNGQ